MKLTGITLLLTVIGLFALMRPSQAQQGCPVACQASSSFCVKTGTSSASCPVAWRGKRCSNMPCAYRQACGCGACIAGCNTSACSVCRGTPGSGQTPAPQSPDSSTPGGSNTPGTPDSSVSRAPVSTAPLTPECKSRCDRNNDGIITKGDFSDLLGNAQTPETQELLKFCSQSCPMTDGTGGQQPGTPTAFPTGGPTGTPDSDTIRMGDCSSQAQPGKPDGGVDIFDIEMFRQEFNKEVQSTACDLDKSGEVDILDFTNFIRPAFAAQFEETYPTPTVRISTLPSITILPSDGPVTPIVQPSIAAPNPTSSVLRP